MNLKPYEREILEKYQKSKKEIEKEKVKIEGLEMDVEEVKELVSSGYEVKLKLVKDEPYIFLAKDGNERVVGRYSKKLLNFIKKTH